MCGRNYDTGRVCSTRQTKAQVPRKTRRIEPIAILNDAKCNAVNANVTSTIYASDDITLTCNLNLIKFFY
jgi:hypothetical protein